MNGAPRMFYIGWYIRDAQRHPQVPRLTPTQIEAMELIEAIANDPAFHIEMDFQPGDIQLLNNAKILHAREAYEDADDPREQRHLLRLWLAAHHFTSVEDILRSGIPAARLVPYGCRRRIDLEHGALRVDRRPVEQQLQVFANRNREHQAPRPTSAGRVRAVESLHSRRRPRRPDESRGRCRSP